MQKWMPMPIDSKRPGHQAIILDGETIGHVWRIKNRMWAGCWTDPTGTTRLNCYLYDEKDAKLMVEQRRQDFSWDMYSDNEQDRASSN